MSDLFLTAEGRPEIIVLGQRVLISSFIFPVMGVEQYLLPRFRRHEFPAPTASCWGQQVSTLTMKSFQNGRVVPFGDDLRCAGRPDVDGVNGMAQSEGMAVNGRANGQLSAGDDDADPKATSRWPKSLWVSSAIFMTRSGLFARRCRRGARLVEGPYPAGDLGQHV